MQHMICRLGMRTKYAYHLQAFVWCDLVEDTIVCGSRGWSCAIPLTVGSASASGQLAWRAIQSRVYVKGDVPDQAKGMQANPV